jgi:hypothetical protein
VPGFINDLVARTLAGVTSAGRPVFLKMVYHGPRALEELVSYDPHLVVGILGGAAGTTLDAFQLIYEVKKYGGRAALFGRKINQAECQLAFIEFLRHIADGLVEPLEAVRAYHAVLEKLGLRPHRSLEEDLTLQSTAMSYGGASTTTSLPARRRGRAENGKLGEQSKVGPRPAGRSNKSTGGTSGNEKSNSDQKPDFARMTADERLQYHRQRLGRIFGE